jgi:hypothetical protein
MGAVLCITANLSADWQLWVIFDRSARSRDPLNVRYASNTDHGELRRWGTVLGHTRVEHPAMVPGRGEQTCRLHYNIRWSDIESWSGDGNDCSNELARRTTVFVPGRCIRPLESPSPRTAIGPCAEHSE